jgi:hypothetical protein
MGGVTWRHLGLGLGLLLATVARAESVAPTVPLEPPPRAPIDDQVEVSARWASDVRFGISAGNVLLVPFVVPGRVDGAFGAVPVLPSLHRRR